MDLIKDEVILLNGAAHNTWPCVYLCPTKDTTQRGLDTNPFEIRHQLYRPIPCLKMRVDSGKTNVWMVYNLVKVDWLTV